jgi:hypothetical protein
MVLSATAHGFKFMREAAPERESSTNSSRRGTPAGQRGATRARQGDVPGKLSGQQTSPLDRLISRSSPTEWQDLPTEVAHRITQRTKGSDKIALFFASKQTRHPVMPFNVEERAKFQFEMAQAANTGELMHVVLNELDQLPVDFQARSLEELTRNLSCIRDSVQQSSYDEIQSVSHEAAVLYARLQRAIDGLPAAHRATALLNLSEYCELLPAEKRFQEIERLLSRQGNLSNDSFRGTLLKKFSFALNIIHPRHVQSAAMFFLNESRKEDRGIRDAVKQNLRDSVDGLLLHAHVSLAIKAAIDAEQV